MRLTGFTVTERELRVASRHRKTYRARVRTGTLSLVLGATLYAQLELWQGTVFSGYDVFRIASFLALMFCASAGMTQTVDCLSCEKRGGTLGLLFLTDLKAYDIVLGKLLASSLAAFYALLGVIPIFALVLLLGGVKMEDFCRVVLNLVLTVWLSLCLGLVVSSCSRDYRRANSAASVLMLLLLALPALAEFLRRKFVPGWIVTSVEIWSPVYTHLKALDPFAVVRTNGYWLSIVCRLVMSVGLLLLACWILPHSWKDRPEKKSRLPAKFRWRAAVSGGTTHALLGANPFCWLTLRLMRPVVGLWFIIGTIPAVILLLGWVKGFDAPATANCALVGGTTLLLSLLLAVASEACQRLSYDRTSGALELLLSTPLSVRFILKGHAMAIARKFATPTAAILLIGAIFIVLIAPDRKFWFTTFAVLVGNIGAVLFGLVWLGMWTSLRMSDASHASAAAFWRLLLLPVPILIFVSIAPRVWNAPTLDSVTLWASGFALNSLLFAAWARSRLYRHFRTAAVKLG